ncbi:MAG TPA: hypothetical protein DD706_04020 [Nitrospiraceae bacterium]|nr:hypothetical protein [Nitrospiraceae bacterium]
MPLVQDDDPIAETPLHAWFVKGNKGLSEYFMNKIKISKTGFKLIKSTRLSRQTRRSSDRVLFEFSVRDFDILLGKQP